MQTSLHEHKGEDEPRTLTCEAAAFQLCELTRSLTVADELRAIAALEHAALAGGADAALFVSMVPEAGQALYRSIAALDPGWSSSALRHLCSDPLCWLAHAKRSSEPLLVCTRIGSGPAVTGADRTRQERPRAIWLVPAPPPVGSDVLGVLMLAGREAHQLDPAGRLMPVYRALALGLTDWFQRRDREALMARARLTDRDLDLLRHESIGHGSKRIATALHAEPKTIDCWFHRLNMRLGVANRREAVRLCQRYGLL